MRNSNVRNRVQALPGHTKGSGGKSEASTIPEPGLRRHMKIKPFACILIIGTVFITMQCKSGGNKVGGSEGLADTLSADTGAKINYLLPYPDEIIGEVVTHRIKINPKLVNPLSNADKYLDTRSQALNLGVYIADFTYLNLNNNKTNALEYFKLIRNLAQHLNIYGAFSEEFFNRVQKNLMNNDSLGAISEELYDRLSESLETSNRLNLYALVSTGAFIEAIYLSALSIPKYSDYQDLVKLLFEQKALCNNYYGFAYHFRDDADVKSALAQMDSLKVVFNLADIQTNNRKVTRDNKNHLTISGGDQIITNELAFVKFVKNVAKARGTITGNSK